MNISREVQCRALTDPDHPAVIFGGDTMSYAGLDTRASQLAQRLHACGVAPQDRIVLLIPNTPEFPVAYLATMKTGAVVVPLNPALKAEELAAILEDCAPVLLLTVARLAADLRPLLGAWSGSLMSVDLEHDSPADRDLAGRRVPHPVPDLAVIAYTSGTTGVPKGVMLSHRNILTNVEAKRTHLGLRPSDRLLLFLPLFHCFGQNAIMNAAFHSGATLVLHPDLSLDRILASIERDGVTMVFGVPAAFSLMRSTPPARFRSVRLFFSAAAPLPLELDRAWAERFGQPILQGYGLTETSPFAAYNHRERHRPGSLGSPIDGVEMKIVDPSTGADLPAGAVGEIVVRGPNIMLGYWRRDDDTRAVLQDGWFHTGDLGRRDAEGYYYYEDRLKDMINVAGQKVYPAEVEAVLRRHPAVADAAVFGVAEPVVGESVAARVVLREGFAFDPEDLSAHCRAHLARYKWPLALSVATTLPRSPSGKILKRLLRAEAAALALRVEAPSVPPEPALATPEEIEGWLCAWLQRRRTSDAGGEEVDALRTFSDQGCQSLDLVLMIRELGGVLRLPLPPSLPWACPSPHELAERVAQMLATSGFESSATDSTVVEAQPTR